MALVDSDFVSTTPVTPFMEVSCETMQFEAVHVSLVSQLPCFAMALCQFWHLSEV